MFVISLACTLYNIWKTQHQVHVHHGTTVVLAAGRLDASVHSGPRAALRFPRSHKHASTGAYASLAIRACASVVSRAARLGMGTARAPSPLPMRIPCGTPDLL
jgi:hypothetical protein